jgi:hypothetical protein
MYGVLKIHRYLEQLYFLMQSNKTYFAFVITTENKEDLWQ